MAIASALIFVGSLLAMPHLVARIDADYFSHDRRPRSRWGSEHPAIRLAVRIGKNVLAAVLMLAGLAMLILPGQGLLTLFVGFVLVDFPGKYRLEKWLVSRRLIHRPINWLRARAGHGPLTLPPAVRSGRTRP